MAPKQNDDSSELHSCHICWAKVTSTAAEHEASSRHKAAAQLAATALARLRAHLAPRGASNPAPTEDQQSGDATHTMDTPHTPGAVLYFCGSCAAAFPSTERANHSKSRVHLKAALEEQILDELVREYIDEEDIVLLDPSQDDEEYGFSVTSNDVVKKYTCHMCAIKIPEIYRDEHEWSSRHRSCVALANAAARRTGAYLVPTTTDLPLKENDNITALLNAYIGIIPITDEEQKSKKEAAVKTVKKRLTSKEYFTKIVPYLQYIGAYCTLIVDDTDYVTIKSATDTLRIHVVNFNGLYSGEQECGKMKCKLCNGFGDVFYPSLGDKDKMHVMSLGHIKRVLKPIDNIHGIRKVNDSSSLCILCNVAMSSFYIKDHVLNDIQHTAMLTEAFERGRAFKESEKDLKIVMYSSLNNDYFQSNPTIHGNVRPGFHFGQPEQNYTSPQKNLLFGATPQNTTLRQPQEHDSFARPSGFGTASTFAFHPAVQSNIQNNQNSTALFGSGSTQQTGFGQSNQNFVPQSSSSFGNATIQQKDATQNQINRNSTALFGSGSTQQTGFGQSNQNLVPQSSSSFGIATIQQTDSSQNQNKSYVQSLSFGFSNQQTGFRLPNQTASVPNKNLPALGVAAAVTNNQNNSSPQKDSAFGTNKTKD